MQNLELGFSELLRVGVKMSKCCEWSLKKGAYPVKTQSEAGAGDTPMPNQKSFT